MRGIENLMHRRFRLEFTIRLGKSDQTIMMKIHGIMPTPDISMTGTTLGGSQTHQRVAKDQGPKRCTDVH